MPDDLVEPAADASSAPNVLYKGSKDGVAILARIVKKKDEEWLQLWQNPRAQVLQLLPRPIANMAAAKVWLVDACKRFCAGACTKAELEAEKVKFIEKEVRKRPAAAATGPTKAAAASASKKQKVSDDDGEAAADAASDNGEDTEGEGPEEEPDDGADEDEGEDEGSEETPISKKPAARSVAKRPAAVEPAATAEHGPPPQPRAAASPGSQPVASPKVDKTVFLVDKSLVPNSTPPRRTPERAPEPAAEPVAPPCDDIPSGVAGFGF